MPTKKIVKISIKKGLKMLINSAKNLLWVNDEGD